MITTERLIPSKWTQILFDFENLRFVASYQSFKRWLPEAQWFVFAINSSMRISLFFVQFGSDFFSTNYFFFSFQPVKYYVKFSIARIFIQFTQLMTAKELTECSFLVNFPFAWMCECWKSKIVQISYQLNIYIHLDDEMAMANDILFTQLIVYQKGKLQSNPNAYKVASSNDISTAWFVFNV